MSFSATGESGTNRTAFTPGQIIFLQFPLGAFRKPRNHTCNRADKRVRSQQNGGSGSQIVSMLCQDLEITKQTDYRWRRLYEAFRSTIIILS